MNGVESKERKQAPEEKSNHANCVGPKPDTKRSGTLLVLEVKMTTVEYHLNPLVPEPPKN